MPEHKQDHLFISYASEDSPFAEWLTLKLTGEGYRVWCDHIKLLGGESYPKDIDVAIKLSTFRMLAILSHNSINKENPRKERTLGLNISNERGIDFIIPLNLDGLSKTELDWMSSDLTYIQFHGNWAQGLSKLFKKLASIEAPKELTNGKDIVVTYLNQNSPLLEKEERIESNLLEVLKVPKQLLVFEFKYVTTVSGRYELSKRWPFFSVGNKRAVSFVEPDNGTALSYGLDCIKNHDVSKTETVEKIPTRDIIKHLIIATLQVTCHKKGMLQTDQEDPIIYFPDNCLPDNRLHYKDYKGRKNWFSIGGERHLKTYSQVTAKYHYHIGARFDLNSLTSRDYFISIRPTVYVSDAEGNSFRPRQQNARTKHILKSWYNSRILNYQLGIIEFLADGEPILGLGGSTEQAVELSTTPLEMRASLGIDEAQLASGHATNLDSTDEIDDEDAEGEDSKDGEVEDE